MVAEIETDQFSLFLEVSSVEIEQTKSLLSKYMKIKTDIEGFDSKNPFNTNVNLEKAKRIKSNIEKAAELIIDVDERRIIEYRFLRGFKRKETVLRCMPSNILNTETKIN